MQKSILTWIPRKKLNSPPRSARHMAIFLKSEIPIYNSEVQDTAREEKEHGQLKSVIRFRQTQQLETKDHDKIKSLCIGPYRK